MVCSQASLRPSEAVPGTPQAKGPPVPRQPCRNHAPLTRLMAPPGGTKGPAHPWSFFTSELGKRGGFGGPVQSGDVMTERRFSPPLPCPPGAASTRRGVTALYPYFACVFACGGGGGAGRSELRVACFGCSCRCRRCPAVLDRRADEAPAPAPQHRTRLGAGPRREGGRARVGGCRAGRRAGARKGKRRGRRVSRGPGRPGDVDA